jgi:glycosyltransferase involved in cell wall biosynthesis
MTHATLERAPLISVIMPTYNRADLVGQAIDSVRQQDFEDWELIVVDDGSTDETPEILSAYGRSGKVHCVRQENAGQSVARNRGLQRAKGKWVAFLDSDNRWLPHKLSTQVNALKTMSDVDVLYGDIELIDEEGRFVSSQPERPRYSGIIWRQLLHSNCVNFNTSVVRREKIEAVGRFDERLRRGEDYDLWLRLSANASFQYLPGVVAQYRVAGARVSDDYSGVFKSNLASVENFFESNPNFLSKSEAGCVRAELYARLARSCAANGLMYDGITAALTAIRFCPNFKAWRTLAAVIVQPIRRKRREAQPI